MVVGSHLVFNPQLIIYDLDGTLVDSLEDIANSVNRTMAHFGLPRLPEEQVRQYVGTGARHLIRAMVPITTRFDEIFNYFLADYDRHLTDKTTLYPGVAATLERLKNKRQAVLSNKPTNLSEKIVTALKIAKYFSRVWGSDSGLPLKPDPTSLLKMLDELKIDADAALIVGDSPVDIEAGKRAGIKTCAVTYGLRDKGELVAACPSFMIDRFTDLQRIVATAKV